MKPTKLLVFIIAIQIGSQANLLAQENRKYIGFTGNSVFTRIDTTLCIERPQNRIIFSSASFNLQIKVSENKNASRDHFALFKTNEGDIIQILPEPGFNEYMSVSPNSFTLKMAGFTGKPSFSPETNFYNLSLNRRGVPQTKSCDIFNNPVYRLAGEFFNAAVTTSLRMKRDPVR